MWEIIVRRKIAMHFNYLYFYVYTLVFRISMLIFSFFLLSGANYSLFIRLRLKVIIPSIPAHFIRSKLYHM